MVRKRACTYHFTIPEIKIAFVLFYWLVSSVVVWTGASIRIRRDDTFHDNIRRYADCMAGGNQKYNDCHELRLDLEAEINPVLEVITFIFLALLNFASLPFVIQFETVKKSVRRATSRLNSRITTV